ncbi:uncharacterized protein BKA78DRAFT_115358 [Phyllosticta capitalensis]|uniref:uncharacterized protein n=1 Tax=Phyllosticta capitalensis TaxID=121624 RepID=UPI00312E358C
MEALAQPGRRRCLSAHGHATGRRPPKPATKLWSGPIACARRRNKRRTMAFQLTASPASHCRSAFLVGRQMSEWTLHPRGTAELATWAVLPFPVDNAMPICCRLHYGRRRRRRQGPADPASTEHAAVPVRGCSQASAKRAAVPRASVFRMMCTSSYPARTRPRVHHSQD